MSTSFSDARRTAHRLGEMCPVLVETVPLDAALGRTLAAPVRAAAPVPGTATSAMDGWAVSGTGPWRVDGAVRMGEPPGAPLPSGAARAITTGGALPAGATAVLRRERARIEGASLLPLGDAARLRRHEDVRLAGEELEPGDVVARAGVRVTPAVMAAAAVGGADAAEVVRRPRVALLLLGDEVVQRGIPEPGQVRDAFGVSIPGILRDTGADVVVVDHLGDDRRMTERALRRDGVDVLVTTGGTGHGSGDHLVSALEALGAVVPVRGIGMRPGHPTVLAVRPDGVPVLGLPGNPFAALAALVALGLPLIAGLTRASAPPMLRRIAASPIAGASSGVRLVAVTETPGGMVPVGRQGSAMTRGLVQADALAIVEGAGVDAGDPVDALALPWTR